MSLPTIDEESSDGDLPPPPQSSPPPSYESLQFPRTILRLHVPPPPPSPAPNHHHQDYYYGVTIRTLILLFSLAFCLFNALFLLVGNGFMNFGVSESCLVASWFFHIFIFISAGLRNKSLITYLADYLKYIVYCLGICTTAMAIAIGIIFAIIGHEIFMTNFAVFKIILGYIAFLSLFTLELIFQVVFICILYNELFNEPVPRVFY